VKRFSDAQTKFYIRQIVIAIEYLHSRNIIYRDLKPENCLLDLNGSIKLTDFGLAKQIGKDQKSYSFCGSPEYLAPEMLQTSGHDLACDIY